MAASWLPSSIKWWQPIMGVFSLLPRHEKDNIRLGRRACRGAEVPGKGTLVDIIFWRVLLSVTPQRSSACRGGLYLRPRSVVTSEH